MKHSLLIAVIATILSAGILIISFSRKEQSARKVLELKIEEDQKIIDSLHDEAYKNATIVQRYEIAVDMLRDEDSIAHEKFMKVFGNTE